MSLDEYFKHSKLAMSIKKMLDKKLTVWGIIVCRHVPEWNNCLLPESAGILVNTE